MVTEQQTRSQFSAYAILAAPMMISGSILDMTAETLKTYTNKEVPARLTARSFSICLHFPAVPAIILRAGDRYLARPAGQAGNPRLGRGSVRARADDRVLL